MTKTYTKKQFLEDVAKEARALKKHATKEEVNNLDLDNLDPNHFDRCIFGQMTGDCRNERAAQLIFSCCKRYFKNDEAIVSNTGDMTLKNIKKIVNGTTIKGVKDADDLFDKKRRNFRRAYRVLGYPEDTDYRLRHWRT